MLKVMFFTHRQFPQKPDGRRLCQFVRKGAIMMESGRTRDGIRERMINLLIRIVMEAE